jgi:hypothetical protein
MLGKMKRRNTKNEIIQKIYKSWDTSRLTNKLVCAAASEITSPISHLSSFKQVSASNHPTQHPKRANTMFQKEQKQEQEQEQEQQLLIFKWVKSDD